MYLLYEYASAARGGRRANSLACRRIVREDTGMIQTLVSLPPQLDAWLRSPRGQNRTPLRRLADFVASDPPGAKLGSGGGTVALLHATWRETCPGSTTFSEWLGAGQRLVLHAGGESRRLPAYAAIGKSLLPVPAATGPGPSRFDQVLADFQVPTYRQVLHEAGTQCVAMVASGDVWLEFDPLQIPRIQADITGVGMRVAPEVAQHFGVFFVARSPAAANGGGTREQPIAFFLQKPSPAEIYRHAARYDFYVDTGLWLFSAPAVRFLFRRCGWRDSDQRFATTTGNPSFLDLYTEIGAALGAAAKIPPRLRRLGLASLATSVVPLDEARFLHVGSTRQLLESFEQLAASNLSRPKLFSFATPKEDVDHRSSLPVWIDRGSGIRWTLDGLNVVTGALPGIASLHLRQEQCLDIVPVGRHEFIIRPYLVDDRMRGQAGGGGTICGQDAASWLDRRGFPSARADVFALPIYPVLRAPAVNQSLIDWFFAAAPDPELSRQMAAARRVSAAEIPRLTNFQRLFSHQADGQTETLRREFASCGATGDARVFRQDFAAVAEHAKSRPSLRDWLVRRGPALVASLPHPEQQSRMLVLLAELNRGRAKQSYLRRAQTRLQRGVLTADPLSKAHPRLALKEDQIVWGRSPVRLDLAGGWTDTPPYCLEQGGAVLNAAVLLNGQPPIQVFVRPLRELVISLRSIDLGSTEVVRSFAGLATYRDPRSGFSLPKAALAMAGFLPEFAAGRPAPSLRRALERFGSGLEISLLSAVPKGSGLGTSSILAATILGALNRACNLGWDEIGLYQRVLGVEQLLTTGGGWQDQAGALFRGIKLVETAAGPRQTPSVRYLPDHLFGPADANQTLLLYYTGMTRLAKGILKEIVQDMFLGRFETLQTLAAIRANAQTLFRAIQQNNGDAMRRCIGRSWELNKQLDSGTSTPEIESILEKCGPDLVSAKLLGAGGGGYILFCARDSKAGQRIRDRLEKHPPNARSRFIDFEIANSGLEVTVS
ncbi:MAG TPA: bifunctional fucokinase/fucose-1-phosphate guanylyltransferase [Opitutaceae bacterium]|nr:bifunctional fucokinase/fucose-1-phosphate guanylyltransferase [Opitutaceae bacterium]